LSNQTKLSAEIDGERRRLDVRREGARVFAEVDGRRYELEASEVEPGVYMLVRDGRVYEIHFGADAASGARPGTGGSDAGTSEVRVRGGREAVTYGVALFDPKRLRGARGAAGHDGGRAQITAPMPGKVVRVLVERGREVEAGEPVVVVEAMKMQNELKSPKAGTVTELHAEPGATVNAGDVLAVIE
jgi:biotin carboxyl carrier protein